MTDIEVGSRYVVGPDPTFRDEDGVNPILEPERIVGKVGTVTQIDSDGDALVVFDPPLEDEYIDPRHLTPYDPPPTQAHHNHLHVDHTPTPRPSAVTAGLETLTAAPLEVTDVVDWIRRLDSQASAFAAQRDFALAEAAAWKRDHDEVTGWWEKTCALARDLNLAGDEPVYDQLGAEVRRLRVGLQARREPSCFEMDHEARLADYETLWARIHDWARQLGCPPGAVTLDWLQQEVAERQARAVDLAQQLDRTQEECARRGDALRRAERERDEVRAERDSSRGVVRAFHGALYEAQAEVERLRAAQPALPDAGPVVTTSYPDIADQDSAELWHAIRLGTVYTGVSGKALARWAIGDRAANQPAGQPGDNGDFERCVNVYRAASSRLRCVMRPVMDEWAQIVPSWTDTAIGDGQWPDPLDAEAAVADTTPDDEVEKVARVIHEAMGELPWSQIGPLHHADCMKAAHAVIAHRARQAEGGAA